eukprot:1570024-Rhodomonas_salina.1
MHTEAVRGAQFAIRSPPLVLAEGLRAARHAKPTQYPVGACRFRAASDTLAAPSAVGTEQVRATPRARRDL